MSKKNWNNVIFSTKVFLITMIILTVIIPTLLGNFINYSSRIYDVPRFDEKALGTNAFTKENYSETLIGSNYGLGNITIDDLQFNTFPIGLYNENVNYPLIIQEHESRALFMEVEDLKFITTSSSAVKDNLGGINKITNEVLINETLKVEYNYTTLDYLIYHSLFSPATLINVSVNNGTVITELTEGEDYFIDDKKFLVFNYKDYFRAGSIFNFTMYIIWEVSIIVANWEIAQQNSLIMNDIEQELTAEFGYIFSILLRYHFDLNTVLPVDFVDVALTANLPDKEKLNDHELIVKSSKVDIAGYLNPDKSISIELSDQFSTNSSLFALNFTSLFTVGFEEPVEKSSWSVDRLVEERNIRERIYFPTVISGPEHLLLRNVKFHEPTINFEQVISNFSLFERDFRYSIANDTVPGDLGIYYTIPYLYVGETCPSSLRYITIQDLRIVITDSIKMPLIGANVEILYYGTSYGTYMSNDQVQPIPLGRTNENGDLVIEDVPSGNYSVLVFYQNSFIKQVNISTDKEINFIYTDVFHFPLWILIFGTVNGIVVLVGVLFYLKNKKSR
ncbi:MAG: hypothetical protein ACXAEX_05955 [Promethearchaeota archaeon]|jgi:hypothetical protein